MDDQGSSGNPYNPDLNRSKEDLSKSANKKVGLARLAKTRSLSGSINKLNLDDFSYIDGRRTSDASISNGFSSEVPLSPLQQFAKEGSYVPILPNKYSVANLGCQTSISSELPDQRNNTNSMSSSNTSPNSNNKYNQVPRSDPELFTGSKPLKQSKGSDKTSSKKDASSTFSKFINKRSKVTPKILSKSKETKEGCNSLNSSPLLSRHTSLKVPSIQKSNSFSHLADAFQQIHSVCLHPVANGKYPMDMRKEAKEELCKKSFIPNNLFVASGDSCLSDVTSLDAESSFPKLDTDIPQIVTSNISQPSQSLLLDNPAFVINRKELTTQKDIGVQSNKVVHSRHKTQLLSSYESVPNSSFSEKLSKSTHSLPILNGLKFKSEEKNVNSSSFNSVNNSSFLLNDTNASKKMFMRESNSATNVENPSTKGSSRRGRAASCVVFPGDLDSDNSDQGSTGESSEDLKSQTPRKVFDSCKSFSFDDGSMGPSFSIDDAKHKNYLWGGLGNLLGESELLRYYPDRTLTIFIATWNMNGKEPPMNLDAFLLPKNLDHMPDMYVIGTQEFGGERNEWEVRLQTTIGPTHVLFTSAILGILNLTVFLRRDLIWFCSVAEEAYHSLRPGTYFKTKGAVAIGFQFFGTRILFINSHLFAHEEKQAQRINNFKAIISSLDIPRSLPSKTKYKSSPISDVTRRYDVVFWMGDLNFRLIENRDEVIDILRENNSIETYEYLLLADQLNDAKKKNLAFADFHEGPIHFPPTFKYDPGTDDYDSSSKQRVPSYTDRILFKSNTSEPVACVGYNYCPMFKTSDHKPVWGVFQFKIRQGNDNIPLAAGLFNREVYLEALKRRRSLFGKERSNNCKVQ